MPVRLCILGASPCERCTAQCCKQTVSEFAVLLQTAEERRRFAAWAMVLPVRDPAGTIRHEHVMPYRDGRCPFLGDDDRCTIYDDRPSACRAFECVRSFNQLGVGRHGYFVANNERMRTLLNSI
ncbi:MAG: YkgJ family cysteine cluster protein [Tepidisphaeraceae bacterium]